MPVGGRQRGERVCVGWEQGRARGGAGGAAPVARVDDTQNVLRWGGGPMGLGPWEQHRCVANGRRLRSAAHHLRHVHGSEAQPRHSRWWRHCGFGRRVCCRGSCWRSCGGAGCSRQGVTPGRGSPLSLSQPSSRKFLAGICYQGRRLHLHCLASSLRHSVQRRGLTLPSIRSAVPRGRGLCVRVPPVCRNIRVRGGGLVKGGGGVATRVLCRAARALSAPLLLRALPLAPQLVPLAALL
mmetsp:Transcript_2313/g.5993  ORF Transcript_2313/g.5993 Transcript_2313/m.5993 type:complete len:239 (+) Transcript_2313:119-835(+)